MARRSGDDLAYGGFPERWDRSRFERLGGGGPPRRYEEDYTYREQDRPGRRDVMVSDRIDERGPRGRYDEQERYFEEDRYTPGRRPRRTDRELFGDVDPRDFANTALTPYEPPPPQRPSMIRRQSSLDTFDRRPMPAYEREERRIPVYRPVPVPYEPETRGREYYQPESYREVEIRREKSVQPYPKPPKSVKSTKSGKSSKTSKSKSKHESSSSSSSATERQSVHPSRGGDRESVHESESYDEEEHGGHETEHFHEHKSWHQGKKTVSESINETVKSQKKGKTRMPKRLVCREAIQDLGYPFEEEEFFFVLKIALDKEQIDEVIKISETYWSSEKKTVFKFDETIKSSVPQIVEPQHEREEIVRTEWINPPFVAGSHRRSHSHSSGTRYLRDSDRSRHTSRAEEEFYEDREVIKDRETIIEERRPPNPPQPPVYEVERKTVYKEEEEEETLSPTRPRRRDRSRSAHRGALVVRRDPEHRSTREINDEIARLEAESRALRLERSAETRRDLVIRDRREEDHEIDWYGRPAREVVEFDYREPRSVTKVEKDRKERERQRILKLASATLT